VERITGPFLKYRNASSTHKKKTDTAASCVTKLSVRGHLSFVPLTLPSLPSVLLRRTPWAPHVIVHHRSGWYHWKEKEMKRTDFRAIKIGEKCAMCECTNRPASLFYKNAKESNSCHGLDHIFQF